MWGQLIVFEFQNHGGAVEGMLGFLTALFEPKAVAGFEDIADEVRR